MGLGDTIKNKAEELAGNAKEAIGKLTGDEKLEAEGQVDQASGNVKEFGNNASEKVEGLGDKVEGYKDAIADKLSDDK